MKHGKYEVQKATHSRRGVRVLMVALAVVLAVCCATGGTIAWLTSTPDPVSGTFVVGNVSITLSDEKGILKAETAKAIATSNTVTSYTPGQAIESNPKITVEAGSEACFIFIHIEEENNSFSNNEQVIQWTLNDSDNDTNKNWSAVQGHAGYYCTILKKKPTENKTYTLFKDGKLTVNPSLTNEIISAKTFGNPTITITAAAVQMENIPNSNNNGKIGWRDAWELLPSDFTGETSGT